jgi:fatty acid desaturase
MSDLAPRSGGPPSRRAREQRAYRVVVTGGVAGAVAVVGAVLAIVGVVGWWLPILAVIVAAICGLIFRRTVS